MGMLDDVLNKVAGDGTIPPALMAALASLLVGKTSAGQTGAAPQPAAPQSGGAPGGMFGGLGELLSKLKDAGASDAIKSWVGDGANAPIQPEHLSSALGQHTIASLARQAGMSEQELLSKLATVLPGLVDKLTPDGRVPDPQQVAARLGC